MIAPAHRAARWVLATVLVLALGVGGMFVGRLLVPGLDTGTSPSGGSASTSAAGADRLASLRVTIESRAAAALAKDQAGWLAAVDPAATTYRAAQQSAYAGLTTLPVDQLSYRVQRLLPGPGVSQGAPTGTGPVRAEVVGSWTLRDFDAVPAPFTVVVTARPHGSGWLLTGDEDPATVRQAFELPGVTSTVATTKAGQALVIGNAPATRLSWYAAAAPDAVSKVAAAWGAGWTPKLVVVLPATAAQFAQLDHGAGGGLGQVAAVTYGSVQRGRSAAGDKILINPDSWKPLGDKGRRLVLSHETVHVATRASTTAPVPDWLSEGLAQVIAYQGLPVNVAAIAGRRPTGFPGDRDFDPAVSTIEPAYEMSWLAVHYLSDRYTLPTVVALYRAAGSGASLDEAMRSVLGAPLATVERDWLTWAAAQR